MLANVGERLLQAPQQHQLRLAGKHPGGIELQVEVDRESRLGAEAAHEAVDGVAEGGIGGDRGHARHDRASLVEGVARESLDRRDAVGRGIRSPLAELPTGALGQDGQARESLRERVVHVAGQPLALHGGAAVAAERLDLGLRRGEFADQACALLAVLDDARDPQAERDGEGETEARDCGGDGESRHHRIPAVEDPREQGEAREGAESDDDRSRDGPASVCRQHPGQRVGDRLQDREEGLARAPAGQSHGGAGDEDGEVPRPRRRQCGPRHEQIAQHEQHERRPGDGDGRQTMRRSIRPPGPRRP